MERDNMERDNMERDNMERDNMEQEKIRVGVSSCLLGEPVRYDGQHKLNRYVRDTLGQYLEFVPVCPEVEAGLPVPREPMHLQGDPEAPRVITTRTRQDITDRMVGFAKRRVEELADEELCGFIFKSRSPSSGMERVKIYDHNHVPHRKGVGTFAAAFMRRFPLVPVEEEGRLNDAVLRENFITRLFVFRRWRRVAGQRRTRGALVAFHTRHKLLIMAHSPKIYREMGQLVGSGKQLRPTELFERYQQLLMQALKLRASVAKNANVLQHIMGYFKRQLAREDKAELVELIERYRRQLVPLIVPLTLINHYVRRFDEPYLAQQVYLNPHPVELRLRNHV